MHGLPARSFRGERATVAGLLLLFWPAVAASEGIARTDGLLEGQRNQEPNDQPRSELGAASPEDLALQLTLAETALRTGRPDEAKALFARSLAIDPDSVEARLGLARALLALDDYAGAVAEFERVFDYAELPFGPEAKAEVYGVAASQYEDGRRTSSTGYAVVGVGNYRVGSAGGGPRNEPFYSARVGGRVDHRLGEARTLRGSLDYRFRDYDAEGRRNDSDLRWNGALRGSHQNGNWSTGVRGWVSYRGNAYRNDFGGFGEYGWQVDKGSLNVGAEIRQRRYPTGRLRDRTRNILELTGRWTRALFHGKSNFTLSAHAGREFNTNRVDGDSNFFGLSPEFDFSINEEIGGHFFIWWQNDRYAIERLGPPGDEIPGIGTRNDDLYEVGLGLSWEFSPDWTLNPQVLYIRDDSNILAVNYSSTELWLTLRNDF